MNLRTSIIYVLLTLTEKVADMKIKTIAQIVCVFLFVLFFVLLLSSSGCNLLSAKEDVYKSMYENSQLELAKTTIAYSESIQSEKILRNSLDSLYKYADYKIDSLYSAIAVKDILLRSNNANIDTMLWSINEGVINYINKLRAKYGLEGL